MEYKLFLNFGFLGGAAGSKRAASMISALPSDFMLDKLTLVSAA
jgi:hypothetical protein